MMLDKKFDLHYHMNSRAEVAGEESNSADLYTAHKARSKGGLVYGQHRRPVARS